MSLLFLVVLIPSVLGDIEFGVANVNGKEFCVAHRPWAWTITPFHLPNNGATYRLRHCGTPALDHHDDYDIDEHIPAILVDASCNTSSIAQDSTVFVKAPFTPELTYRLKRRNFTTVIQVRGNIRSEINVDSTVFVRPIIFGNIYWGTIILYFAALIYVALGAVTVYSGKMLVEKHAQQSPLEKIPCLGTRACLILFLISFFIVMTVIFTGYFIKPVIFQPLFSCFLTLLAVVGFYHLMFPVIVLIAIKYIRIVNKTFWTIERAAVIVSGLAIFSIWWYYRTEANVWPLQIILLSCVGVVPLRYAPLNCIKKLIVFTIIGVFYSVLQTYILPTLIPGKAPVYVDLMTVQARIPDTFSPSSIFFPDAVEGNMFGFRIPLFGDTAACSDVLDSTFGVSSFILPALYIKAAMLMDLSVNVNTKLTNYTVAVVMYLVCHVSGFIVSFVTEMPVNANILYLPGILTAIILNSIRTGTLKQVFNPPLDRPESNNNDVIYKVTSQNVEDNYV